MKTNTISKLSFMILVMLILTSCEKEKLQNRIIYAKHDTTITSIVKFDTLFCDIFPYVDILAPVPLESEVIYTFDVDQDENDDFKIEI